MKERVTAVPDYNSEFSSNKMRAIINIFDIAKIARCGTSADYKSGVAKVIYFI